MPCVDGQGRVTLPLASRRRLDLREGDELDVVETPEGLILEKRVATTLVSKHGIAVATRSYTGVVSNDEAVAAIHAQRGDR